MNKKIGKSLSFALLIIVLSTVLGLSVLLCSCAELNNYTISFDVDGTTYSTISTSGNDTTLKIPVDPTKENYAFAGWYLSDGTAFTASSLSDTPITGDITVYAKWHTIAEYSLNFVSNGGSEIAAISYHGGETIVQPSNPTRIGYTFDGWFTDDGTFANVFIFSDMPANTVTLYAKWIIEPNAISFDSKGGSAVSVIAQEVGEAISEPSEPTKPGYSFGGWFTDETFSNAYSFSVMPAGNITLYAKWNIRQFTISFDSNEGSSVDSITQDFGTEITEPSAPTKYSCVFGGWFTDDGTFVNAYIFSTMPAGNVELFAKWISETGIYAVTAANVASAKTKIESYIDSWLGSHAQDGSDIRDQSDMFIADLAGLQAATLISDEGTRYSPTVQVTFDGQTKKYAISIGWNNGLIKLDFSKDLKLVNYGNWAGELSRPNENAELLEKGSATDSLTELYNAAVKTLNDTYSGAKDGVFSTSCIAYIDVMGSRYGLEIKGNFNIENAVETEIALSLLDEEENVIGALYYIGATTAEDCKLVLRYGDKYKYINYVAINEWLQNAYETDSNASDSLFDEIDTFSDLLLNFGMENTMASVVSGLVDMLTYTYSYEDNGNTTYLLDFDLASILAQVSGLIDEFGVGDVMKEQFKDIPILNELDFATMSGLMGHITLAGVIDAEGYLTNLELAVNIAESTFLFSDDAAARTIDIPCVNLAIGLKIKDFVFGDNVIENIIPTEADEAEYFSLYNVDLSGDLYIKHVDGGETVIDSTYTFDVVTNINPFNPSQAEASIVIDELKTGETVPTNFLTVIYKQNDMTIWLKGTALDDVGTTYYVFDYADISEVRAWLGYNTSSGGFDGISISPEGLLSIDAEVATSALQTIFASDLGNYIINRYYDKFVAQETEEFSSAAADTLFDSYNAIRGLYETFAKNGNIVFNSEEESLKVAITPTELNMIISAINNVCFTNICDVTDPEYIDLYFNYADTEVDYTDKLYVEVKYGGNVYTLLVDNTAEDEFTVTFTMATSSRLCTAVLKVEDEIEAVSDTEWVLTLDFTVTDLQNNVITLVHSNFDFNWGEDNTGEVAVVPTDAVAEDVFAQDSLADILLDKAVNSFGDNEDSLYFLAESIYEYFCYDINYTLS